jgi:hypothetical protein
VLQWGVASNNRTLRVLDDDTPVSSPWLWLQYMSTVLQPLPPEYVCQHQLSGMYTQTQHVPYLHACTRGLIHAPVLHACYPTHHTGHQGINTQQCQAPYAAVSGAQHAPATHKR